MISLCENLSVCIYEINEIINEYIGSIKSLPNKNTMKRNIKYNISCKSTSQILAIYHWNFYVSSLGCKIVENSTKIIIQLCNNDFNHSQSMTCSLHNKINIKIKVQYN